MLTAQFSALTILFSLCAWFIGHQASHCAAYRAGSVELSNPVALIMGLETFLGLIFLAWFAYMDGISHAASLFALSFVVRLALVNEVHVVALGDCPCAYASNLAHHHRRLQQDFKYQVEVTGEISGPYSADEIIVRSVLKKEFGA